ncbi:hypothetical protein [Microcystis phage Mae-JY09]
MSSSNLPAVASAAVVTRTYLDERAELVRQQLDPKASRAELEMFLEVCAARGLNPLTGQIHAVSRWDNREKRMKMSIQTGIDGFRLIAQRTGEYRGQVGPQWCGADGQWRDVWLEPGYPAAARVGVLRAGWTEPLYGVARWSSYVQTTKEGSVTRMWDQMPDVMLAKVAEALALRKAFPEEMSGLYTGDEMAQAQNPTATVGEPVAAEPDPVRELELSRARELLALADGDVEVVKATLAQHDVTRENLTDDDVWDAVREAVEARKAPAEPAPETPAVIDAAGMRKVHAKAKDAGLDHDAVHALALEVFSGIESTKQVPAAHLDAFLAAIETRGAELAAQAEAA